jgi:hypothetical protein
MNTLTFFVPSNLEEIDFSNMPYRRHANSEIKNSNEPEEKEEKNGE